jgi:hypothetical protein
MQPLTIIDIREWLIENRTEYQKLKAQKFPPFENEFYFMYGRLQEFISYYQYKYKCEKALRDLKRILSSDFSELIEWTKVYETLGSEDLFMFKIYHIDWKGNINSKLIKIYNGLYAERSPFANIICFCRVFELLYWDNELLERVAREQEKTTILKELTNIIGEFYVEDMTN